MPLTIDIHAHHFPTGLADFGARTGDPRWPRLERGDGLGPGGARIMRGDDVFRRVTAACFNPAARIAELDAAGVDRQVISPVPVTLIDWAPPDQALAFLGAQNDRLAEIAAGSDGRLIALGAVPLHDPHRAVAELARIHDDLGLAGVEITAMAGGRELDDTALDPFWAAAATARVPVFIHPAHQAVTTRRSGMPYEFGIGMLTDTALAAAALVYGGVLDRHPDLRIALAHGCGAFAWTHPRLRYLATGAAARAGHDPEAVGAALDDLVRTLWVDCLVFDPAHVTLLVQRFGADHVLYGTDHPFLPEGFAGPRRVIDEAVAAGSGLDDRCLGANAATFLGL
ncbi:MAG: amidohydrolase family protein [Acidimicrobiales bacterium]